MRHKRPADGLCEVQGCSRPWHCRGMCRAHDYRARQGLDLDPPIDERDYSGDRRCSVDGCDLARSRSSRFYCVMHAYRVRTYGEPGEVGRRKAPDGHAVWDTPSYRREYQRLKQYGITPEDYDALLTEQRGRCAICGTDDPCSGRARTWCVDHDHVTGAVRGLLCSRCNRALGMFRDDPEVLEAARRYLLAARTEATA